MSARRSHRLLTASGVLLCLALALAWGGAALWVWSQGEVPQALTDPGHVHMVAQVPRNFARAILGQEKLWIETGVAINTVRTLDAAYRSAASGQVVRIA